MEIGTKNSYKSTSGHLRLWESQIYVAIKSLKLQHRNPLSKDLSKPHSTCSFPLMSYIISCRLVRHVYLLLTSLWECHHGPLTSHLFSPTLPHIECVCFNITFFLFTKEFKYEVIIVQNAHDDLLSYYICFDHHVFS